MPSIAIQPSRWSEQEIAEAVAILAREFPLEPGERIRHVVDFCQGAIFPGVGRDQLGYFTGELLRRLPASVSR